MINIKNNTFYAVKDQPLNYTTCGFNTDGKKLTIDNISTINEKRNVGVWTTERPIEDDLTLKITVYFIAELHWFNASPVSDSYYVPIYTSCKILDDKQQIKKSIEFFIHPERIQADVDDCTLYRLPSPVSVKHLVNRRSYYKSPFIRNYNFTAKTFKANVTRWLTEYLCTLEMDERAIRIQFIPDGAARYGLGTLLKNSILARGVVVPSDPIWLGVTQHKVLDKPLEGLSKEFNQFLSSPQANTNPSNLEKINSLVEHYQERASWI